MLCRAGCLESNGTSRDSLHFGGLESPINQIGEFLFPDSRFTNYVPMSDGQQGGPFARLSLLIIQE